MNWMRTLNLALFADEPTEPREGGGVATADPTEPDAPEAPAERGEATEDGQGAERETFDEKLDRIARSEDLAEFRPDDDSDVRDLQDPEADSGDMEAEDASESGPERLPEGYTHTEDGKVKGPDGKFVSKADVEALLSGEEPAPKSAEDAEAAGSEGAAADDEPLTVAVPGRRPEDEDVELPLDRAALEELGIEPDDARERIQQLRNGYMRRQELNRHLEEIETDRAELAFIEKRLSEDPEDFVLGHVAPEIQGRIAERVLATMDDEQFDALLTKLASWDRNPVARREEALRLREERLQKSQQVRDDYQDTTAQAKQAAEIGRSVNELIPEDWDEGRARRFFRYALTALQDHVIENHIETLDPADVPSVLGQIGVLDDVGLSSGTPATGSATADSADSARPEGPADEAQIERARRAGEEVRERTRRRREAAATTPAGAGSSVLDGAKVPKGQSFEERMSWLEKKLGIRRR